MYVETDVEVNRGPAVNRQESDASLQDDSAVLQLEAYTDPVPVVASVSWYVVLLPPPDPIAPAPDAT